MTPGQKRAAGMGVVGYVRVSAAGQTDGWSLGVQEQAIRDWAAAQELPLLGIEVAPDGHESGATAFQDRVGWQAVERHIASGRVGWIAVAAIDRLSRDLQDLADQVRQWEERHIAVVAPLQGYAQPDGIGPFLIHIWGVMADHERKRLRTRVLSGMQARLQAGLPLGRQPFGYRVVSDVPAAGMRPRRHLTPDPANAPIIRELFQQALSHPDWGDPRLAAWASGRWPHLSWSVGRIRGILTNEVYSGVLRGTVIEETVLLLDSHPALVDQVLFLQVQSQRAQRSRDREAGFRAVGTSSWLGGIARCGRCGGSVSWRAIPGAGERTGAVGAGHYVCVGGQTAEAEHRSGCGATWTSDIEVFVQRVLGLHLDAEKARVQAVVHQAGVLLPQYLDERRATAQATLAAIDEAAHRATEALAVGSLDAEAYEQAIRDGATRRTEAQTLLGQMDGWEYLARLIALQEGADAHGWRWMPIGDAIFILPRDEQRRLLRAAFTEVILQDPTHAVGSLDGPGEDHRQGRYTWVSVRTRTDDGDLIHRCAQALARILVRQPGWSVDEGLRQCGWSRHQTEDGRWRQSDGGELEMVPR